MTRAKRPKSLPPFPRELGFVWDDYRRLARRRQIGMDACPITYEAVEAYSRLTARNLEPWVVDLVMRIDDALLAQGRAENKPGAPPPPDDNTVPVTDGKTMKSLFRGLMAGQQARKAGSRSQATK